MFGSQAWADWLPYIVSYFLFFQKSAIPSELWNLAVSLMSTCPFSRLFYENKFMLTRLALVSVLGPFGVHCSIFLYICACLCSSFHSSFEYTLRSTWRQHGSTQAKNAQYNLVRVYRSQRMHWHMLKQVIYRERKKISFDINWHKDIFARIFYLFTTAFCAF